MARLPDILGSLEAEAKKVYDRIASKRGRIGGPFAALMHHPPLAERVAAVGEYLRYDATLPGDIRELAIIITARHVSQPYEWVAHAAIAIREGLPEEIVEQVRTRRDLSTLPARYLRAARLLQHVLARESIPQALQDEV